MIFLKRYPYIFVTIIATIIAIMVWMFMPKFYSATITIGDEYQETDLAIGLNTFTAKIKNATQSTNAGINDIGVYAKVLKSEDFARTLSKKQVPGKNLTYAQYIQCDTPVDEISKRIEYNLKDGLILTVQLRDHDALVASQMLDSAMVELQKVITSHRIRVTTASLINAQKNKIGAGKYYHKAQQKYAEYYDAHSLGNNSATVEQELTRLSQERDFAYALYQKSCTEYVRQKMLQKRTYESFAVIKANNVPTTDDSHLLGNIAFAIFFSLIATKAYKLFLRRKKISRTLEFGNIVSPWSITIIVWGALCFLLKFRDPSLLDAPTDMFYTSLTIWLVFFCVTSFVTYNLLCNSKDDKGHNNPLAATPIIPTKINSIIFKSLLAISIIITPLYVKNIMDVVMMFGTEDIIGNIRTLAIQGSTTSFLNYSYVINETLLIVSIWLYPNIKKWQMITAIVAFLLNSLAIMEKGGILLIIFCIVFILYQRHYIKLRTITLLIVAVLFLSYGFNNIRNGLDEHDDQTTILSFIAMYLLSPPVAYCRVVQTITPYWGVNSFPALYWILYKYAGGDYVAFERVQEFVFVPVSTNVYTIFQPFYQDFGQLGILIFAVIYGIICGLAYRKMCDGVPYGKCLYTYLGYILVLQFFQEYLFSSNTIMLQFLLLMYVCVQKKLEIKTNPTIKRN